ncbi:MAG: hypothetical protein MSL80_04630 [Helicobacter sp.]|uniref:hypothetical protein n=1 Tax=Helicobacter sp. TaxID=218 RepID=UPI003752FA99|nr:hypothetical protein [Helicobacter sp.]
MYPTFLFTLTAQLAIALCGVFLAPAFATITLGIVGREQYALQTSKNEAYKHARTAFSAGLSLVCAWYYGITSIFIITILMRVFLLLCLALLRNVSINHALARGDEESTTTMLKPKSLKRSFMDKRIMALSFAMFCFHLSNAAMLLLLSQRAHTLGIDSSGAYAAATIIIAQSTMIFIALVCGKLIVNPLRDSHRDLHDDSNSKLSKTLFALMAISLLGLCVRAMIAANYEGLGGRSLHRF